MVVIFASIAITVVGGSTYMSQIPPTELAKEKEKIWGHSAWSVHDPWMGNHAPTLAGKGQGHLHPGRVLVVPYPAPGADPGLGLLRGAAARRRRAGRIPQPVRFRPQGARSVAHRQPQPGEAWHYVHHRDPRAVTPGSIMPAFKHLTDEELDAIIAFLESLR